MSNNKQASSGGIGVAGLLGVAFVILKLTGVIHWSWWWVLAPFWMPIAASIGVLVVVGLVILVLHVTESADARRRRKARSALRGYARSLR